MLTIRLPERLLASIEAESQNRRISKSQVVREHLERPWRQVTGLEDIADLIRSVDGLPNDLSERVDEYLHQALLFDAPAERPAQQRHRTGK